MIYWKVYYLFIFKLWSNILFIIAIIVCIKSQNLGLKYYDPNEHPSSLEAAFYASLNRPVFAFAIVSLIVLLTVGEGLGTYQLLSKLFVDFFDRVIWLTIRKLKILFFIFIWLDGHRRILQPRWAQPISKLTYGAYLVHHVNQSYDIAVRRNARTFSIHNMVRKKKFLFWIVWYEITKNE